VAGKAYFVSQGEPVELWPFVNRILALAKLPPVTRRVSVRMAYLAGAVLERWHRLTGRAEEPRMTRFLAVQLGTSHWFDISAARRELGYEPAVGTDEGLRRLGGWLTAADRIDVRR
jgi:nucleoside-diphosphate-sugar epimerase